MDKSALVLLVACWERYLEELADAAFIALLDQCGTHAAFPSAVTELVAKSLRSHSDPNEVWKLAGDGWRSVLKNHKTAIYKRTIYKFHNPNSAEIDTLFCETLGFENLTNEWHWKGMTAATARKRLALLVERRHDIAHKVETSHKIGLNYLTRELDFLSSIAAISSNRIGAFIAGLAGKPVVVGGQEWTTTVTYKARG